MSAPEAIVDSSVGIMIETILEGMAEYYSVDLSETVVCGMADNTWKSMFNGGIKPIGHIIDKEQPFRIDLVAAPFILAGFERYVDGATMTVTFNCKEGTKTITFDGVKNEVPEETSGSDWIA